MDETVSLEYRKRTEQNKVNVSNATSNYPRDNFIHIDDPSEWLGSFSGALTTIFDENFPLRTASGKNIT